MVTVKSSQKIFTDSEVASLTGFASSMCTILPRAVIWASSRGQRKPPA